MEIPLSPTERRSNRAWVIGFVGFCAVFLLGTTVFAVVRMPTMLALQIREARRVDLNGPGLPGPMVFVKAEHRDALAKIIEDRAFRFNLGATLSHWAEGGPADPKQALVLEAATANRSAQVDLRPGGWLRASRFWFHSSREELPSAEIVRIAKPTP